jgi:hypothetical protein
MQLHVRLHGTLLLSVLSLALILTHAQDVEPTPDAQASKYPLRLHVLAIDKTYPTERLQPNWCSNSVPQVSADAGSGGSGGLSSPCGGASSYTSFGGDDDFSGAGRGDLVTPPGGTQAFSFTYDGCSRVRVPPGFTGLPARWKKPGKLEVLIPTDAIGGSGTRRCTLTAKVYEFVYLRVAGGSILKVSQEAYNAKPALRRFLSGGTETLQTRVPTVSVKQLMASPR